MIRETISSIFHPVATTHSICDKLSALPAPAVDSAVKAIDLLDRGLLRLIWNRPDPFIQPYRAQNFSIQLLCDISIKDGTYSGTWIDMRECDLDNPNHKKIEARLSNFFYRLIARSVLESLVQKGITKAFQYCLSSQTTSLGKIAQTALEIISTDLGNWAICKCLQSGEERKLIPVTFTAYVITPSVKRLAVFGAFLWASTYFNHQASSE